MSDNASVNYMSGSPLNRCGWLRHTNGFVNASAVSPRARWLLFRSGKALIDTISGSPVELPTTKVESLLGPKPYFGQGRLEGEFAQNNIKSLENARLHGPIAVFLGIWERLGKDGEDTTITDSEDIKGDAYFSLDVSKLPQGVLDNLRARVDAESGSTLKIDFIGARMAASRFDRNQGAIFASALSMVEWNSRIKFCASCGSPVYSIWAGWKLACSSLLPWAEPRSSPCPTISGLHAHQYPRTDCAIITGIIDETGEKILLGNNKKFPGCAWNKRVFYSTLAGFIEPGETFEEAVAREIYEESGVKVHNVQYHSTQPWPYPGSLMIGFYARADASQPIKLVDSELADAKWYTREQVLEVLGHPDGTNISSRDHKKLDDIVSGRNGEPATQPASTVGTSEKRDELPFRVPPRTSIAGVLISEWAYGKFKL